MLNTNDFSDLTRIATNSHPDDKQLVRRVVNEFNRMEGEIRALKSELKKLKEKEAESKD